MQNLFNSSKQVHQRAVFVQQNRFINVQNLFNSSKQVDGTIHLVSVRGWK